ncbi:hypothetical protein ANN_27792 [Periplaneta americana]|uniref:DDE Tnp4 domain-containing protein n=1 Tax=Periplaneta americana TaxID=6978 RepID=A0ABQ8RVB0_PERAM|nr:hypothetical protein ANN_27792 [Periplaneta americana]
MRHYINFFPPTREQVTEVVEGFQHDWGFHNVSEQLMAPTLKNEDASPYIRRLCLSCTTLPHGTGVEGQKKFNFQLSRARHVVENAFGIVKRRFRIIGKWMELHLDNVPTVIKACCILHNICEARNDHIETQWTEATTQTQPIHNTITGNRDTRARMCPSA